MNYSIFTQVRYPTLHNTTTCWLTASGNVTESIIILVWYYLCLNWYWISRVILEKGVNTSLLSMLLLPMSDAVELIMIWMNSWVLSVTEQGSVVPERQRAASDCEFHRLVWTSHDYWLYGQLCPTVILYACKQHKHAFEQLHSDRKCSDCENKLTVIRSQSHVISLCCNIWLRYWLTFLHGMLQVLYVNDIFTGWVTKQQWKSIQIGSRGWLLIQRAHNLTRPTAPCIVTNKHLSTV